MSPSTDHRLVLFLGFKGQKRWGLTFDIQIKLVIKISSIKESDDE